MAKRKMLFHPDYVREKIRASQLLNRLQKCAFGEISLTITQLRAIEILLRKSIPDLAAVEITDAHKAVAAFDMRRVIGAIALHHHVGLLGASAEDRLRDDPHPQHVLERVLDRLAELASTPAYAPSTVEVNP